MAGAMVRFSACALLLSTMVLAVMAAQPYPKHPVPNKKSKCTVEKYEKCYDSEHVCPHNCPGGDCVVDCVSCKPICKCDLPGAVCQDPRFIGGDGITFYFHGKKEHDFCLVSDSNLHINARFIGRRNQNMMRDFTWVQSIGAIFDSHKLYIGALKTSTWDDSVDRLAVYRAKWESNGVSITRSRNTNSITVEVEGNFKITANVVPINEEESRVHNYGITQEDCFLNGVLGQTYGQDYTSKVNMSAVMPVMGGTRKFLNSALFSTDCSVSRFGLGGIVPVTAGSEFAGLECGSSMEGRGIVCKK
ncbi:hypothetical protein MKW94_015453 [Papaver nudicaule]|uniref:Root cap n=1 Tax=Papaver nudicaule TaxID=74823 RepID=A0AA41SGK2_PAPNU|nr:hypothetical protein [Papaver nudicaule]